MPTYVFRCDTCDNEGEVFTRISDLPHLSMECSCGGELRQVITSPSMVMDDIQPYRSMIDGSIIHSRSHHRQHLKDHGCVEVGNDSCFSRQRKPLESPPGLKDALTRAVDTTIQKKRG